MMNFKEALQKDLSTFHNVNEFAKHCTVYYDGDTYINIPVVITGESKERKTGGTDHETLLFLQERKAFIKAADMEKIPRKNHAIQIDETEFDIKEVKEDCGQYVLNLEAVEE